MYDTIISVGFTDSDGTKRDENGKAYSSFEWKNHVWKKLKSFSTEIGIIIVVVIKVLWDMFVAFFNVSCAIFRFSLINIITTLKFIDISLNCVSNYANKYKSSSTIITLKIKGKIYHLDVDHRKVQKRLSEEFKDLLYDDLRNTYDREYTEGYSDKELERIIYSKKIQCIREYFKSNRKKYVFNADVATKLESFSIYVVFGAVILLTISVVSLILVMWIF